MESRSISGIDVDDIIRRANTASSEALNRIPRNRMGVNDEVSNNGIDDFRRIRSSGSSGLDEAGTLVLDYVDSNNTAQTATFYIQE